MRIARVNINNSKRRGFKYLKKLQRSHMPEPAEALRQDDPAGQPSLDELLVSDGARVHVLLPQFVNETGLNHPSQAVHAAATYRQYRKLLRSLDPDTLSAAIAIEGIDPEDRELLLTETPHRLDDIVPASYGIRIETPTVTISDTEPRETDEEKNARFLARKQTPEEGARAQAIIDAHLGQTAVATQTL
jgi:hypothetical protein